VSFAEKLKLEKPDKNISTESFSFQTFSKASAFRFGGGSPPLFFKNDYYYYMS
jgi:hypothetical protein